MGSAVRVYDRGSRVVRRFEDVESSREGGETVVSLTGSSRKRERPGEPERENGRENTLSQTRGGRRERVCLDRRTWGSPRGTTGVQLQVVPGGSGRG